MSAENLGFCGSAWLWANFKRGCLVAFAFCFQCSLLSAQFSDSDVEFFENKIRPILVDHCYQCHSPGGESLEAGFNLATRKSLIAGGDTGPAIVPGDSKASLLIDAVNYRGFYEMPPNSKLPAEKIRLLEQWVDRGAPWPEHDNKDEFIKAQFDLEQRRDTHWCWQTIAQVRIPNADAGNWPLDDLDRFVFARLKNASLQPASDADRRTWIRRVYFDLIGLPPSPEEIDQFVIDEDSGAFETVVDRLLDSQHFGERWARHWKR